MLILVDSAEHRARLIESIQRRMDEEVEEIALTICQGRTAERPLRRLRLLTQLLASLESKNEDTRRVRASWTDPN